MPRATRRAVSDEGSLKENTPVRVKAERSAKGSNLQTPERPSKRGGRVMIEEEEEEDEEADATQPNAGPSGLSQDADRDPEEEAQGDDDEGHGEGEGSPKGRKRARKNTVGESVPVKGEEVQHRTARETLPRDPKDGYIPGSIVRVQLKNFVTYDFVEFHPGPYLNMILGPNGTGKSSIACAICLGLNFPPSVLGRATDINAFVKKQCEKGYIEIELKGPQGKPNLVVRRNLTATSKSSTFTLNGQSSTGKEVSEKIAQLNIQVGNLCSFLPQDKVSEFARMNPQQLLRETQRAAGDERLTAWHDTLISSGKEMRDLTSNMDAEREQLRVAEERNKLLETDVKRFKERQTLEHDIKLFELIVPFCEYIDARKEYQELKLLQRDKYNYVKKLQEKNQPAHALKDQLEAGSKTLNDSFEKQKKQVALRLTQLKKVYQDSHRLEKESESLQDQLENLRTEEKERIAKIAEFESKIRKNQQELDNPPEVEEDAPLQAEQRRLNDENRAVKEQHTDFQHRQRKIIDDSARIKQEMQTASRGIEMLENVAQQKLDNLRKQDRDVADTIVWLRKPENQRRFKMEVTEPAAITLKVEDMRYATAVEACFGSHQLKTFITQCPEDSALLNHVVNDSTEALGRKGRITVWYRPRSDLHPAPFTQEELPQYGFDGYALDFVSYPDGMLWYLQKEVALHRTAIALNPGQVDSNSAMNKVSASGGASFIVGRVMNQVTRSQYGQRLASNQTRDIRSPLFLGAHTVDENQKKEFERQIADARKNLEDLEAQQKAMAGEEREINAQHRRYQEQFEALAQRRKAITEVKKRIASLEQHIKTLRKSLEAERKKPSSEQRKAQLNHELLEVSKKRAKFCKQYMDVLRLMVKEQEESTRIGLDFVQNEANRTALEAMIKVKDTKYQKALNEFEAIDKRFREQKAKSKELLEASKRNLEEVDDDVRQTFQNMEEKLKPGRTEEMRQELDNNKAKLDMLMATNPGVVEQYERRKGEIASLQAKIEQRERTQAKIERSIKIAQDNWQPALERLVASIGAKFSAAFDRIGCAGEIQLSQAPEFENWAIDILVKFRDKDKLQLLTPHRQSGGERSLTTILYLMSLTEEARAPFSLVDEINQGMDQRAERAVHDQMVEVTCKPDACQYFLITPKLLPGLQYHRLMKILCVNNGEWLPEERGLGNLMKMIDGFVTRRGQAAGAA